MIKFIIYKSENSFSCQLKITDKYRELLGTIDGLFYDEVNHKLVIPNTYFKYFVEKIKQLFAEITLKVYEVDTKDESILRTIDIEDEEEDDDLEIDSENNQEILFIHNDQSILIPFDQQKKVPIEIISSFNEISIDVEKWMWKIPLKYKEKLMQKFNEHNISFIECI